MKHTLSLATAATLLSFGNAQAASVFFDSFDYVGDMIAGGGWTTHNGGNLNGGGTGAPPVPNGILNGQGDGADGNWAEWNYTTVLGAGDILTIDGNVDRGVGSSYGYITDIYLWNGSDAGTRQLVSSGVVQFPVGGIDNGPHALNTESYTVTAGDITAGRDQVIFRYGHGGNGWGETHDVDFGVTPVPEPSGTALLGLAGVALILRRRK